MSMTQTSSNIRKLLSSAPLRRLLPELSSPPSPATFGRELCQEKPCVVFVVRRPGCPLCRSVSHQLNQKRGELETIGCRVVAVVKEEVPGEIEAFHPEFWGGELYLDTDWAFYKALGGGQVRKMGYWSLFNPFSKMWANSKTSEQYRKEKGLTKGNITKGEGMILGGLYVFDKTNKDDDVNVRLSYVEEHAGDSPAYERILSAVKEAVAASSS